MCKIYQPENLYTAVIGNKTNVKFMHAQKLPLIFKQEMPPCVFVLFQDSRLASYGIF